MLSHFKRTPSVLQDYITLKQNTASILSFCRLDPMLGVCVFFFFLVFSFCNNTIVMLIWNSNSTNENSQSGGTSRNIIRSFLSHALALDIASKWSLYQLRANARLLLFLSLPTVMGATEDTFQLESESHATQKKPKPKETCQLENWDICLMDQRDNWPLLYTSVDFSVIKHYSCWGTHQDCTNNTSFLYSGVWPLNNFNSTQGLRQDYSWL